MSRSKPLASEAESEPHSDGSSRPSPAKKSRHSRKRRAHDNGEDNGDDLPIHSLSLSPTPPLPAEDLSVPPPMPLLGSSPRTIPIFVASLGNPKPYLNTLHSAGHIVLSSIATREHLSAWRPFAGGQITEAAHTPQGFSLLRGYANAPATGQVALWKCGAMMNVSGPAVKKAWVKWKKDNGFGADDMEQPRLVIVHDELEKELGAVSVRTDHKASARGHNGLKSLMASMPEERFIRIGVGIGRPDSRERDAVSNYVLRKVTGREMQALEQASKEVRRQLEEVHEGAVG